MSEGTSGMRAAVDAFAGRTIVVIGDFVCDEYLFGRPSRISREAPVLILRFVEREVLPGRGDQGCRASPGLGSARVSPSFTFVQLTCRPMLPSWN